MTQHGGTPSAPQARGWRTARWVAAGLGLLAGPWAAAWLAAEMLFGPNLLVVLGVGVLAAGTVALVLLRRGQDGVTWPRRAHPWLVRLLGVAGAVWAVGSVAADSFWALLAAPVGVFALTMATFRTAPPWWRWVRRAAAGSILTWPAPVLVGIRLDRDAIEAYGTAAGVFVTCCLVGLTAFLAMVALLGGALSDRGRPTPGGAAPRPR